MSELESPSPKRKGLKRPCGPTVINAVDNCIRRVLQDMVECSYCGIMGYKHKFHHFQDNLVFCEDLCAQIFHISGPKRFKPLPIMDFKTVIGDDMEHNPALIGLGKRKLRPGMKKDPSDTYKWLDHNSKVTAAPVECFQHAPCALFWSRYVVDGIKVEVETAEDVVLKSCWVATLEKQVGYSGFFRYVGWTCKPMKAACFRMNICSPLVHPVGWSAANGRPLIPPKSIVDSRSSLDWKQLLSKVLRSATTLPWTFEEERSKSMESRFSPKQLVEVVDKNRLDMMKLAEIYLISAKRLMISYYDNDCQDTGFTCHEDSELLHPIGWSETVGHNLDAPSDYNAQWRTRTGKYARSTTTQLFKTPPATNVTLEAGMKLEAIDPLNLSTICVATIKKVLKHNYMMIRIDRYDEDGTTSDWFCCHATSNSIFPAGFCKTNQINLVKPREFRGSKFDWPEYLKKTNSSAAGIHLQPVPDHGLKEGMHLEVVDLMKPHSVCVGSIRRIIGRLLRIHFDGWSSVYDQWMDCESPDIYPVGWCEAVKHCLTAPPIAGSGGVVVNITPPSKKSKINKGKGRKKNGTEVSPKSSIAIETTPPKSVQITQLPTLIRDGSPISQLLQHKGVNDNVSVVDPPHLSPAHSPVQSKQCFQVPEVNALWNTPSTPTVSVNPSQKSSPTGVQLKSLATVRNEKKLGRDEKSLRHHDSRGAKQHVSKLDFWYEEEHPKILKTTTRSGQLVRYSSGMIVRRESTSNRILKKASKQQNSGSSPKTPLKMKVPRRKSTSDAATSLKKVAPPSFTSPFTLFTPHHFQAVDDRVIPRLVDQPVNSVMAKGKIEPSKWNYRDVAQFLRVNDMEQFSGSFSQRKIDGATFLNLTMSTIIHLVDQKVGPATHIADLIKVLKSIIK